MKKENIRRFTAGKYHRIWVSLSMVLLILAFPSCKKLIEIQPPVSQITPENVFNTENASTAAIVAAYSTLAYSGTSTIPIVTTSCTSDELIDYQGNYKDFYINNIKSDNIWNSIMWAGYYNVIYACNSVLEGMVDNNKLSEAFKNQLTGEALFIRAYCHFQLINIFGDVPLVTTTKVAANANSPRTPLATIYTQIITDLKTAQGNLSDNYVSGERVRANKSAAMALLARVYLYNKNWADAETLATAVINNAQYGLCTNPDSVFLSNSQEAILQLWAQDGYTDIGSTFIPIPLPTAGYSDGFMDSFEPGDQRATKWIKATTINSTIYYYPYKYKRNYMNNENKEYFMLLRLGEMYLVRAEARINNNKIPDGISDLNTLRNRARIAATTNIPDPLPPLSSNLSADDARAAVAHERKVELFTEGGHRWFDLKRTNTINNVLSKAKPESWRPYAALNPIPLVEINANPSLSQNEGYHQ